MKRWPLHKAWFWERAPFFRILLPLMAGIVIYEYSWLPGDYMAVFAAFIIFFVSGVVTGFLKKRTAVVNYAHFISLYATILLGGWLICYGHDVQNEQHWIGKRIDDADAFAVRITNDPAEKDRTWKLEVKTLESLKGSSITPSTGKAFVYIYKNGNQLPYKRGDTILVKNKFIPIKNAGNPFEFDYARYCARNGIYHQVFLSIGETITYSNSNPEDFPAAERVHIWCMAQLQRYLKDNATLGLLQAVLVGDKINLDSEMRQAYAATGIVHIIAISGAHIAIFFFLVAFLFSWIKSKKYKWLKYLIALPLVWFYVVIAGSPPSAVRAAMMFSILGVGFAFQKESNSLNHLLATATILLCANPMWLFAVGFQLSFVAVLSLILFYKPVYLLFSIANPVARILWSTIAASMAAEILIAPLVVYYFHLFPMLFLVANVAAYLFMGLLMIAGMLIIVFSSIPLIAGSIAAATAFITGYFNTLVYWFQSLNPSSFSLLTLTGSELILLYLAISGIAIAILNKRKEGLYVCTGSLCLLVISFCYNEWIALHQERLVVYNVNHINHTELIKGKFYYVLHTDTSLPVKARTYNILPAHIGWHANMEAETMEKMELLRVGNSSVLQLNEPAEKAVTTPVDYLLINYPYRNVVAATLFQSFHPKMMIISGNYSRSRAARWKKQCDSLGIPLHATSLDGAFILESH